MINDAYSVALFKDAKGYEYPPILDEIYQAFDDGEWTHRGAFLDPVKQLTIPALREIIDKASLL